MRILKKISLLILFFLLIFSVNNFCLAIGVQPMSYEFELKAGESTDFKLLLSPSDKKEKVKINIYKPIQDINGNISYQKEDNINFAQADWIKLQNNEVIVEKGKTTQVNGQIEVPFGTSGSHVIVLMIEPEKSEVYNGVALKVRYAVRIIVRVKGSSVRNEGELTELKLIKDEQSRQMFETKVENPSSLDYKAKVELIIRDENRRLIERFNLRTLAGHKNKKDLWRIYPDSQVKFVGWPQNFLQPGIYNVRAILNYADRGQDILTKKITVEKDNFKNPNINNNLYFNIKPDKITSKIKAGKRKSDVIEIVNNHSSEIYFKMNLNEIQHNYQNSLVEWIKLYNYNHLTKLSPRQKERFIKIIEIPSGTKEAGYYAVLNVKAYSDKERKKLLSEERKLLSCLVGSNFKKEVKIEKFSFNELALDLKLLNSGNIHFKPNIEFIIYNKEYKKLNKGKLKVKEKGFEYLLPEKSWRFKTELEQKLSPGEYTFEIEVFDNNISLLKKSFSININK